MGGRPAGGVEAGGWMLTGPNLFLPVEPAPPVLVITRTEEILSINATYQLPHCMPPPDLKYEVDFWKEGIRNKVRSPFPNPQAGPPSPTAPPNPSMSHPPYFLHTSSRKPSHSWQSSLDSVQYDWPTAHACPSPPKRPSIGHPAPTHYR